MTDTILKAVSPDITELPAAEAAALAAAAAAEGFAVFELDGAAMKTKTGLLEHAALKLGFPGDFGMNWDAMIDYLGDMATIHGNRKIMVLVKDPAEIGGPDGLLASDFRKICGLACDNAREWSRCSVALKFVFAGSKEKDL